VKEYHYLLVNYKLTVTWNQCTDHLCCNLSFFGVPFYDCALIQYTETETTFVCLICMFSCVIPDIGNMEFILAQPFTTRIRLACTIDHDLRLKHGQDSSMGCVHPHTIVLNHLRGCSST
ncbi:hypothetical protein F5J12DRAFT_725172, partial [Pisolithus orientalis]|uniref:uncharacterized protein n=1 Tax=Pisolithus orientalis TaxID=936130 RepID=UPI002225882F